VQSKAISLSVKALIRDAQERYLVLRRSSRVKANAGRWDFPGGKVDPGERIDQGLLREVAEETGLTIALGGVVGAAQSELDTRIVAYLILEGQLESGEVRLSEEHDAYRWVKKSEFSSVDMVPQFRAFIETFVATD